MQVLTLLFLAILPVLVVIAGLKDLTTMTIPNWLTGGLAVAFFPAALVAGMPMMDMAAHLAVGLVALFVAMGLFALRVFGGGDAKLLAAVCLWLGVTASPAFVLWTAIAGGLFSVTLLLTRSRLALLAPIAPGWMSNLLNPKGDVPYGVAIAIGAMVAYPSSALITLFVGGR